jgi:hypothetical protein
MQINRDNYEEFFILYMDKELSVEQHREVELFVDENPDLRAELDLLMQSQLSPDASVVFNGKESLLKNPVGDLNSVSNDEEKLLSYLDNELNLQEKREVEALIAANPGIKQEFLQLQRTKLVADPSIVFKNKEILYREEEKVRVIAFNWKRIAIAAGLLLAVSTTAFILNQDRDNDQGPGAVAETVEIPVAPSSAPVVQEVTDSNIAEQIGQAKSPERENGNSTPSTIKTAEEKRDVQPAVQQKKERIQKAVVESTEATLVKNEEKKESNHLPQPVNNPYVNKSIVDNPIAMVTPQESLTNIKETNSRPTVTPHSSQPLDHVVTAASIVPVDEEQPGRKNKLRGFFRKVTRTFEKTTNIKATDDEDRLLLGGLAIKL